MTIKFFLKLIQWPTLVLCVHIFLTYTGGYYWWAHVDKIMHLLGGMSIAASSLQLYPYAKSRGFIGVVHSSLLIVMVVAMVSFVAVGWEFFEFMLDHTFRTNMQPSVADTMGDLLCGLIGGTLIAFATRKNRIDKL